MDEELIEHLVVCHTDGCENVGITLRLLTTLQAICLCGVCGVEILDVTINRVPDLELPIWEDDLISTQKETP